MTEITLAAIFWVASHLLISSSPLRRILVNAIGEKAYLGLYSLIAVGALVNLVWVYNDMPRFEYLWLPNPDLYWVAKITMPIAFVLMVGGFMVPNPSNVGMQIDGPESAAEMARGVTRITRHPFQWAVIIWSVGHIVANGDVVSVVFFSSFALLSLFGSVLLDHKKSQTMGEDWAAYARVTSNVPCMALVMGRNRLVLKELLLPLVVGLLVHGLVYYFHETISGAVIV